MLASDPDTIQATEDGAEALAYVIEHQTTLGAVILDLALPTFNGGAMARRLGQMASHIPILTVESSAPLHQPAFPPKAAPTPGGSAQDAVLATLLAKLAQALSSSSPLADGTEP